MEDFEFQFALKGFQRRLESFSYGMLSQETKAKYCDTYNKFLLAEKEAKYIKSNCLQRIVSVISKDNGSSYISYNANEQKQAKAQICEMFNFDQTSIQLSTSIPKNVKLLPLEQSKISLVSETEIYCREDIHKLPNLSVAIIKAQISDEFNAFEILHNEFSFFDTYKPLMGAHRIKVRLYKCTDFPGDILRKEMEEQKRKEAELIKQKRLDIF